jgi:DNA-binding NarL/FixJ family response regulator
MSTRVALVEDNATFRHRLAERFQFFEDVELVLVAGNGEVFLRRMQAMSDDESPQVVLMDIEMPGLSGIETTRRMQGDWPNLDVIMLTVFEEDDTIFEAIGAGASGYLLKDTSAGEIVGAVLEMVRGGAPMSPKVARKMLGYVRTQSPAPESPDAAAARFSLTDREREVLGLLVDAHTEEHIADALFISPHTVRTHIKNIYKKLHVHSRASVVRVALEHRLVDRDEE